MHELQAILFLFATATSSKPPPNIVFLLADDVGFGDVPWHNRRVRAPTLQRLATRGVILEQAYSQHSCTPSRSALLSGRYPFHIGRQSGVLLRQQPTGLSLNLTLLPERLQQAGYRTHMLGKWHLGYCKPEYTPTLRGFHSFLGYYAGTVDYYQPTKKKADDKPTWGASLRRNFSVASEYPGKYIPYVFADEAVKIITDHRKTYAVSQQPMFLYYSFHLVHGPMQAHRKYWKLYPEEENPKRRTFLAMVSALDDAVSRVEAALRQTGLYENTVIVFTTDNGGVVDRGSSNFPLRRQKGTLFEGGTRAVTFVHSPLLKKRPYVNRGLIHITDWYPTLLRLSGAPPIPDDSKLDGFDQWDTISRDTPSPRTEMVYNIDVGRITKVGVMKRIYAAIRVQDLKLIWLSENERTNKSYRPHGVRPAIDLDQSDSMVTYLFNLTSDPSEKNDLSSERPGAVATMKRRIRNHMEQLVPPDDPPLSKAGHGHVFATVWC